MPIAVTRLAQRPFSIVRRHPLRVFFLLSYVLGWLAFLPMVLGNAGLHWINFDAPLEFLELGACAPLLAALCTQKLAYGDFRICRLFSSWIRTSLGVLLGFGLTLACLVLLPVFTLLQGSPRELHWSVLVTPACVRIELVDILWRSRQRRTWMERLRSASFAGAIWRLTGHTFAGTTLGVLASTCISGAGVEQYPGLGIPGATGLFFSIDDAAKQFLQIEHRCADGDARDLQYRFPAPYLDNGWSSYKRALAAVLLRINLRYCCRGDIVDPGKTALLHGRAVAATSELLNLVRGGSSGSFLSRCPKPVRA